MTREIPGYHPTHLKRLRNLAQSWGVAEILIKDESSRFGLGAFKTLGGSYAVARLLCQKLGIDIQDIDFDNLKQALEMGPDAKVLFFNTEGATDPESYRDILWHGKHPSPKGHGPINQTRKRH